MHTIHVASMWLWKNAWIFVLEHNLFLKAHSFPQATLSKNFLFLEIDNVHRQISDHIFVPNGGYICLYILIVLCIFSFLSFLPVPPIFTESPMNQTIPKGHTARIPCSASGDPLPLIKWFKSQDSIGNDLHFSVLANGTLVINSVSERDSGWFTCRATNNAGTVQKKAYLLVSGMKKLVIHVGVHQNMLISQTLFLYSLLIMLQIASQW